MKRIFSIFLAVVMVLRMIPMTNAYATEAEEPVMEITPAKTTAEETIPEDSIADESIISAVKIEPEKKATEPSKTNANKASSNEAVIYNFLRNEMGLNTAAACGVLANIEKESGFRHDVIEKGYTWETGAGYGICQWTNSPRTSSTGRRTNLVNWCNNNGYDYRSLIGQLNFLKHELSSAYYNRLVTSKLRAVTDSAVGAYEAGYIWCYYFEVPKGYNTGVSVTRGELAKNTYWPRYCGTHPHNYTTLGYDSAHPHKEYMACHCGEKQYMDSYRFIDGCASCDLIAAKPLPAWSFLQGKSIVVMAPNRIDIAPQQYISARDLCIVRDFNAATGQCVVTYPSGGTDVFNSKTRDVALNLSSMLSYNADFETQHLNATKSYTVYPTSDMNQFGTNWVLDPDDEFYTVNRVGNATEVLYYCNRGDHAGFWKLGWIYLDYYYLDLNGSINGQHSGGLDGFGTADIILNGESYGKNITDFYKEVPVGSTYQIENVRGNNAVYKSVSEGSLEGAVLGTTNVVLAFNRLYHLNIYHYAGNFKFGEGNNGPKDNLMTKVVSYEAEYDSTITLDATKLVPAPNGMEFSHISTQAIDGTWKAYQLGVTTKQKGADTNVEYHYKATDYQIIYELNGGTNHPNNPTSYTVFYGVTLQNPTRDGYTFAGWTDEEGNKITGINEGKNMSFVKANGYDSLFAELGKRTVGDLRLTANWIRASVSSIFIVSAPRKTTYNVGDMLNTDGLKLNVKLSDGSTETVTSGFTCDPTVLSTPGKQTITVSYGGKTATFDVTVKEKEVTLDGISVATGPSKTTYYVGEPLNTAGLTLKATYSDGTIKTITSGFTSSGFDSSAAGEKTVTVSYEGKHATFTVTVVEKETEETTYQYGDTNGDGIINLKDVTLLRRMLAAGEVDTSKIRGNPDANGDGVVNLKDVTHLKRYLAGGWGVELPQITEPKDDEPLSADLAQYELLSTSKLESGTVCTSFRFGKSVLDRDLVCWSIQQREYSRTILLNFAIHGWEDEYAADGQLLVDLGKALMEHYSKSPDLQDCRLLIVPCANPDGIAEGITKDGFGRCNADGIDLNRDFDANHEVNTNPRNYTPAPFSGVESRALRDLVWAADPDIVIDFHGWLNYTIGSSELAEVFSTYVGLNHKNELTTSANGYFSYWAQLQGAEAILVEFKDTNSIVKDDVIQAVDQLIADNYGKKQRNYVLDTDFEVYSEIVTYALAPDRAYTQKQVGDTGTSYGYIDGATDECTILQIYENGWCKVNYPVGNLTKTGYCELSAFIDPEAAVEHYTAQVGETVKVYRTAEMTTQHGSVWDTDTFTVVAEKDGLLQIIYPKDSGGYKMGWIDASAILQN